MKIIFVVGGEFGESSAHVIFYPGWDWSLLEDMNNKLHKTRQRKIYYMRGKYKEGVSLYRNNATIYLVFLGKSWFTLFVLI